MKMTRRNFISASAATRAEYPCLHMQPEAKPKIIA